MPKGKRKDPDNLPAFKMTTFHIPPQRVHQPFAPGGHPKLEPQTRADLLFPTSATSSRVNTKNMSSAYQKQESQTTWARRTAGQGEKRKREAAEAEATELPGVRRPTLVISPRSADLPPIVCWLVFVRFTVLTSRCSRPYRFPLAARPSSFTQAARHSASAGRSTTHQRRCRWPSPGDGGGGGP